MQIDWWTLALQGVNFLLLVWLLERFLYRPVKGVIAKRKELAEQAFAEAEAAKREAEAAAKKYDRDRADLARERQSLLKEWHDEREAERQKTVEEARAAAEKILNEARSTAEDERKAAFAALRGDVAGLAADMAASILGKAGAAIPPDAFLSQVEEKLSALDEDEKRRLREDLAANGYGLTVVTAVPLEPGERERWQKRLGEGLGYSRSIDFVSDPDIIGGAELRFPHAVLKYSWADQIDSAKRALIRDEPASR